jgi:hypothetical protein
VAVQRIPGRRRLGLDAQPGFRGTGGGGPFRQGPALPAPAVQGAIATDYQRSLVVLYVTAPDPKTAEAIAQAAARVAREEVGRVWPQAVGTGILTPLDVPVASPTAPSLRARLEGLFRIALGLLLGLTLAFLADFTDPRIWDRRDVERLACGSWGRSRKEGSGGADELDRGRPSTAVGLCAE